MINIDQLKYDYSKPFLDLMEGVSTRLDAYDSNWFLLEKDNEKVLWFNLFGNCFEYNCLNKIVLILKKEIEYCDYEIENYIHEMINRLYRFNKFKIKNYIVKIPATQMRCFTKIKTK